MSFHALNKFSLSKVEPKLQDTNVTNVLKPIDRHSTFSVAVLHLFHLGITKKFKEFTVVYFSYYEKKTSPSLAKGVL